MRDRKKEIELLIKEITKTEIPEPIKEEARRQIAKIILTDIKRKKKPSLLRRILNFFRRTKT